MAPGGGAGVWTRASVGSNLSETAVLDSHTLHNPDELCLGQGSKGAPAIRRFRAVRPCHVDPLGGPEHVERGGAACGSPAASPRP